MARHEIDEALESGLHRVQVAINVGVIELNVGENQRVGKIVHELGPFIEKGRVVLVALDDERASLAQAKAGAEVFRDASNKEGRRPCRIAAASYFINPGQHAGGGRLAVGSSNDQGLVAVGFRGPDELIMDDPRQRGKGHALIEHGLYLNVATRNGISNNDEVGRGLKVCFRKRLVDWDSQFAQQAGHGRIGGLVRTCDTMTPELEQSGKRGHGGTADSYEMDVLLNGHDGER